MSTGFEKSRLWMVVYSLWTLPSASMRVMMRSVPFVTTVLRTISRPSHTSRFEGAASCAGAFAAAGFGARCDFAGATSLGMPLVGRAVPGEPAAGRAVSGESAAGRAVPRPYHHIPPRIARRARIPKAARNVELWKCENMELWECGIALPLRPLAPSRIARGEMPRARHAATHVARLSASMASSRFAPLWSRYVTVNVIAVPVVLCLLSFVFCPPV